MKTLTIGKNYGEIFGLKENCKMIYNGGISWTAVDPIKGTKTMDSEMTTTKVTEYINRPTISMGTIA